MWNRCFALALTVILVTAMKAAQEASAAKPSEHVIGPVMAISAADRSITVRDDKTGTEYSFSLVNTKTLLRVEPGAKDLKSATRITSEDLASGDRVDVRYSKSDADAKPIPARSVLLMSARALQRAHQEQMTAWQNSTAATVTSVDPASGQITVRVRSVDGPRPLMVETSKSTEYTRYSPSDPKTPAPSKFEDIQLGDQVRIIGSGTDSTLKADKIYSGSFKTLPGTVASVSPDGTQMVVKDLRNNQNVHVKISPETMMRKLPAQMAMMLAHRLDASAPGSQTPGAAPAQTPSGVMPPRAMGGDPARMLERMPPAALADLKPGDAVVVTGAASVDSSSINATAVISGVEPLFQSASPRQRQSFGGDWSLDMGVPAQ